MTDDQPPQGLVPGEPYPAEFASRSVVVKGADEGDDD